MDRKIKLISGSWVQRLTEQTEADFVRLSRMRWRVARTDLWGVLTGRLSSISSKSKTKIGCQHSREDKLFKTFPDFLKCSRVKIIKNYAIVVFLVSKKGYIYEKFIPFFFKNIKLLVWRQKIMQISVKSQKWWN